MGRSKAYGSPLSALAAVIPGVEKAMILFRDENKKAQEISNKACALHPPSAYFLCLVIW
jgi:hypothetical protein